LVKPHRLIVKQRAGARRRVESRRRPGRARHQWRLDQAYVNTPDGLRIEILENKNQPMPIQSEHAHFFLPEADIAKSQAW